MKRLNLHSFLLAFLLSLINIVYSSAQTSGECQDDINISLGEACTSAIPLEAFNTWRPSCMIIEDRSTGEQVAAISGNGSDAFQAEKFKCGITVDSIWFDTLRTIKVRVVEVPGWSRNCDPEFVPLNPDSIWVWEGDWPEDVPDVLQCNRDTFWFPGGVTVGGAPSPVNSVVVMKLGPHDELPPCPGHPDRELITDGFFQIRDTVTEYTLKAFNKKVWRVDTFSHTAPLKWIKGTVLLDNGATVDTIHGVENIPDDMGFLKSKPLRCGIPTYSDILGANWLPGSARLHPGQYTYKSYTPDSLNFCWGGINVEYKLWPYLDGRSDTLNCVELSDYDRSIDYDYHPHTKEKLEDVCKWAEAIYTPGTYGKDRKAANSGTGEPGIGALRTNERVAYEVNRYIKHCYTHTVTHKDEYVKNFDWLCDMVIKYRHFYTDHPSHGPAEIKKLTTDTLYILSIDLDSVHFPDSIVVMKCGVISDPLLEPRHVADYLYHAHEKGLSKVIYDDPANGSSDWMRGDPCDLFDDQYSSYLGGAYDISGNPDEACWKMFHHAQYNNFGVSKAFPYVKRQHKKVDDGLKGKFGSGKGGMSQDIYIPINKVVCNIDASKIDLHPIEGCQGEFKIFRQWTLLDWCSNEIREQTQILKTVDEEAPYVTHLDGAEAFGGDPETYFFDADDDNSKGEEDGYFGRLSEDDRNAIDDLNDDIASNNKYAEVYVGPDHGGYLPVRWEKVTNPWGCTVEYKFPVPWVTDHCSDWEHEYTLLDGGWKSYGNTYYADDIENIHWRHGEGMDYPIVRLRVWDQCGNDDEYFWYLKAIDKILPVVVLEDELIVTLTTDNEDFVGTREHGETGAEGEGIAKIYCDDVDAGTHDGSCGGLNACAIRRKGSDDAWEDYVKFSCEDIGKVDIEFRATDWSGNTATGWTTITIESKLDPIITCEDVVVSCSDPTHPDWLGRPHVIGICEAPEIDYTDDYHVDELCFEGYIDRRWFIVGSDPVVQCTQRITISSTDDGYDQSAFNPKTIRWPLHHTGESLGDMEWNFDWFYVYDINEHGDCEHYTYSEWAAENNWTTASARSANIDEACVMYDHFECKLEDTSEPTWTDPTCGLVGKSFEDEHFKFNDGVCFKILRKWAVIDWCVYDPKKGDIYPEEISYVKDKCAGKDYFVSLVSDGSGASDVPDNNGNTYRNELDGYYTFQQEIKVVDETPPVITVIKKDTVEVGAGDKPYEGGPDGACVGIWTGTASATDFCGMDVVLGEDGTKEEGPELDWFVKLVKVDKETGAEYDVHGWRAIVRGGNEVGDFPVYSDENQSPTATYSFEGETHETYHVKWRVEDGCNNPAETVTVVYFIDVKAPSILCYADLSTSVMSTDGTVGIWANDYGHAWDCDNEEVDVWFKDVNGDYVPSLTLDCDDIPGGVAATWEGRVYAFDEKGNESYCEVTLRIVDSNNACLDVNSGAAIIAGEVRTELGDMIESAEISMDSQTSMTTFEGVYAFDNSVIGGSYELDAKKVDAYLNGVSTLDLVLIQKHILGNQLLDSPYKVIAADINGDQKVSAIDLVELRKLILGIYSELPNNSSWRFAEASQVFDDVLNPFPFVENIKIDFLSESRLHEDFIGIKIGDVSGNAIANSLVTEGRNNGSIILRANDDRFDAGELVRVEISSDEFIDMSAFQFTMNVSGLEFAGVQSGAITMTEDNIAVHGNALTAAWFDISSRTVSVPQNGQNQALFTLEFRAVSESTLSNSLSIGSSITDARAYTADADQLEIALAFDTGVEGSTIELYQNTPNPFESLTTIGFQLGETGPATLTVFDVTGKVITILEDSYARGYNEINLRKSDLGASGVLYYQLESGDFTATRKMILID